MTATTPTWGLTYPVLSDPPNVPAHVQQLATDVDSDLTSLDTRLDAVEADVAALETSFTPAEGGEWTIAANLAIGTPTLINNWATFGAAPVGIAHAAGVFTVTKGGLYAISLSCRFSNATADKYVFIAGSSTLDTWFKNASSVTANCAVAGVKRVAAAGQIRCYAYAGAASNVIHENAADLTTGVTIHRIGP